MLSFVVKWMTAGNAALNEYLNGDVGKWNVYCLAKWEVSEIFLIL